MNKEGYKIIDITGGHDSRYGDVLIVKANPNTKNEFGDSYSLQLCNVTETFISPEDDIQLHNLLNVANGGKLWYPFEKYFFDDKIFDDKTNASIVIHRHVDFFEFEDDFYDDDNYNEDAEDEEDFLLIPNLYYKVQFLREQYTKGFYYMQYPTFKAFVASQPEDDGPMFWRWLFENPDFTDDMTEDIPTDYKEEFERFLDFCDEC